MLFIVHKFVYLADSISVLVSVLKTQITLYVNKELTRSGTGAGCGWQCDSSQLSLEPPHDPLHLVEARVDVVAEQRQHCGHGGGSQQTQRLRAIFHIHLQHYISY